MQFTFQTIDGNIQTFDLSQNADGTFSALIGDKSYSVELLHTKSGSMLLRVGDERYHVHAAKDGKQRHISINGKTIRLEKTAAGSQRRTGQTQAGDLTAKMPGQVMKVLVAAGDLVKKGDTLIILEAMKMEMRIKSPFDGRVKGVLCSVGNPVERSQRLVEVEAES